MKKDKIKVYPLYLDLQAKNLFGTKKILNIPWIF